MSDSGRPKVPPPGPDSTPPGSSPDTPLSIDAATPGRNAWVLLGVVAVVGVLIAGVLITTSLGGDDGQPVSRPAAGQVYLQAAQSPGLDPFIAATEQLVDLRPVYLRRPTQREVDVDQPVATQAISGTDLGLYGGTKRKSRCNIEGVIRLLDQLPSAAAEWAGTQGIEPSQQREFVESLTSGVLLRDTRVTNFGLKNGRATPFQTVLQAGTAVLFDSTGSPRVRCACANPLNRPVPQSTIVNYVAPRWDGFDPSGLAVIAPAEESTAQFVLQDLEGGEPFVRERGTSGESDEVAEPSVAAAISPTLLQPDLGDSSLPPIGGALVAFELDLETSDPSGDAKEEIRR